MHMGNFCLEGKSESLAYTLRLLHHFPCVRFLKQLKEKGGRKEISLASAGRTVYVKLQWAYTTGKGSLPREGELGAYIGGLEK